MNAFQQHGPAIIALGLFIHDEIDEVLGVDLLVDLAAAKDSEGMLDDLYNSAVEFLVDEGYSQVEIDTFIEEGTETVKHIAAQGDEAGFILSIVALAKAAA